MTTPNVTEIARALEPVARDTFIDGMSSAQRARTPASSSRLAPVTPLRATDRVRPRRRSTPQPIPA